ncbi:MAG TPA: hypothetical protein VMT00_07595 [Thermoanaerobaculia bacterium]|nr:hypothetical protein [Thermoanaerobaculia bacterium]
MNVYEKVALIFPASPRESYWTAKGHSHPVIVVRNYNLLEAALDTGVRRQGREVFCVVFDQSIDSSEFLQFLTGLPHEFRGDVVLRSPDGGGFLSAIARDEGRVIYMLQPSDMDFYLGLQFGEIPRMKIPQSAVAAAWASAS